MRALHWLADRVFDMTGLLPDEAVLALFFLVVAFIVGALIF